MSALGHLIGVGAATPFGLDARQSAFVVRAAKLTPRRYLFDPEKRRSVGSVRARRLPDTLTGVDRMLALGVPALREAVRDAGLTPDVRLSMFVALPEPRGLPADQEAALGGGSFVAELANRAEITFSKQRSQSLRVGHAGFAGALTRALAHVAETGQPAIAGGVDSYHHPDVIRALDAQHRILGAQNHGGMVPSEGAAFVVVASSAPADRPHLSVRFARMDVEEPPTFEEPRIAELSTRLLRDAVEATGRERIELIVLDVNSERHRTKEWSFCRVRLRDLLGETLSSELRLPREAGDLGAASGAFAASFFAVAQRAGFARSNTAFLLSCSEGPERGVVVLEGASG